MVYLLGKNLSLYKRVWYALRVFDGVGLSTAQRICDRVCIHPLAKVKDLNEDQLVRLKELLQSMLEKHRQDGLLRMRQSKARPKPIQPT